MGWQTLLFLLCLLLSAVGLVFAAIVGIVVWIVRRVRKKEQSRPARQLATRARTAIASATGGSVVKIEGRVRLSETLAAPLSGRACAYFVLSIEQKQSRGRSHWWENAVNDRRGVDFFVEDETGRARVAIAKSSVDAEVLSDANASSGMFEKRTPPLEALLRRYRLDPQTVFGIDRAFRYHEGALIEGERVAVSGTAHWELDPDGGPQARRLVISAPANASILVSDHPDAWQR